MKPRLFDGEHAAALEEEVRLTGAAMKPRLFDGEHADPVKSTRPHFKRRNEAPPVRRGAPNQLGLTTGKVDAAMKPRLFDGEHAVIAHTPCQPLAPQ